jgi:3-hydroxyisobutyrate dehydrogenase-like beta-hydroxyacid dehydrogenase
MGSAFALNLLADGYCVKVYDWNHSHVEAIESAGAHDAPRLADLADCDIVLTSLPDDNALAAVALGQEGFAKFMKPGAVHLSMSTISPGLSRRLAKAHETGGQGYVAAPVLGNPDLARARGLFILASGRADSFEMVRPLLERLGERVFVLGEDAAAANLMKLAGNVLTALTLESLGEVLALLRKGGIDQHVAFDVLTNSLFDAKVHKVYGGKIIDERYSPAGMAAPLAVKDLRLALAEAERTAVPMPAASLVRDRLVAMLARGWSELDWSALGLLAARDSGLDSAFLAARSPGEP